MRVYAVGERAQHVTTAGTVSSSAVAVRTASRLEPLPVTTNEDTSATSRPTTRAFTSHLYRIS